MEDPDTHKEGGQGLGGKPNPSGGQKGGESDRQRQGQEGDKESVRPSPSGVPNEGRRAESQQDQHPGERHGLRRYVFKGGQQEKVVIRNPDDRENVESAGKSSGTEDPPDVDDETRNPA